MGIIASNSYLVIFSAGTLVGATSAFFLLRSRFKPKEEIWKNGTEERYEFEDPKDEYRLIMGVRNDLKMQKGKVAAQCGHAAVAAYAKALKQKPGTLKNWLKYGNSLPISAIPNIPVNLSIILGGTKIAVRLDSEQELLGLDQHAKEMNVLSSIVRDAGQTQVAPGSRTVIAIGPAPKSVLDKITGHLKLY